MTTNDVAISVKSVSKYYKVHDKPLSRVLDAITSSHARSRKEVKALEDISFDVKRGEAVAIIGENGSGKSTLLEIISGTIQPSQGSISLVGRVAPLLELGSGFDHECSGRENIFLNGLLLGASRSEIIEKFDEIIEFADIGDVIDRPVKSYSTGMVMRLAFAVQIVMDPDILIVDEALSVGDYFFQQKCFGRLRKMLDEGLTLLLVSHDLSTVRDFCPKALFLDDGRNEFFGDTKVAIRLYTAMRHGASPAPPKFERYAPESTSKSVYPNFNKVMREALWTRAESSVNDPSTFAHVMAVEVKDSDGQATTSSEIGGRIVVLAHVMFQFKAECHIALTIKNKLDQVVSTLSSMTLGLPTASGQPGTLRTFGFEIDLMLESGDYSFMVSIIQPLSRSRKVTIDATDWFGPFRVSWNYEDSLPPFLGMFGLPVTFRELYLKSSIEQDSPEYMEQSS